jgi:Zn-dependent peptidase ImmA (M78 family)
MKKEASKFRSDHGLDTKCPINTKNMLMNLKVLTIFRPIQSDFSGMAIKCNDLKFILINSKHSIGRQNYSILHEIYHLFIQKDFNTMICYSESSNKKNASDRDAELFASLILLPEEGILDKIPKQELSKNKITLPTIYEIEQYFMCSRIALLNRLKNMDLIDDNKRNEYKENIVKNAKLYGYDDSLYK